jgi:hypothetical protein
MSETEANHVAVADIGNSTRMLPYSASWYVHARGPPRGPAGWTRGRHTNMFFYCNTETQQMQLYQPCHIASRDLVQRSKANRMMMMMMTSSSTMRMARRRAEDPEGRPRRACQTQEVTGTPFLEFILLLLCRAAQPSSWLAPRTAQPSISLALAPVSSSSLPSLARPLIHCNTVSLLRCRNTSTTSGSAGRA